jgi:hypothetical protein
VKTEPELRYEIKLVCDQHWLPQARSWIRLHPAGFVVAYPPRRVNNLYLDTLHLSSLNANLDGLSVRQKLRLRWYGEDIADVQPYLEHKQKSNMLVSKKRHPLPCRLDLTHPWTKTMKITRVNVGPEWQAILQTMDQPMLLNHYQREYYVTPDGSVRVTLDFAQAAYDQRFSPHPNLRTRLPVADTTVIEIKTALEHVERLHEVVSCFPAPRSRNSKYVSGMMTALSSQ